MTYLLDRVVLIAFQGSTHTRYAEWFQLRVAR